MGKFTGSQQEEVSCSMNHMQQEIFLLWRGQHLEISILRHVHVNSGLTEAELVSSFFHINGPFLSDGKQPLDRLMVHFCQVFHKDNVFIKEFS